MKKILKDHYIIEETRQKIEDLALGRYQLALGFSNNAHLN